MLECVLLLLSMMLPSLQTPPKPNNPVVNARLSPDSSRTRNKKTAHSYRELRKKITERKQRDILQYAFKNFKKVPGFSTSMHRLTTMDESNILGHLYEIEAAVDLHQRNYAILSFNQIKQSPQENLRCEVDIEVKNGEQVYWVECKDICWNNPDKTKKQLCRQHTILTQYNELNETEIEHMICSKKQIPDYMKKWLINHNIDTYSSCNN